MESSPDFLLWVQAAYQTFFETLVPRLAHGGTRSISLPRWYIKNIKNAKFWAKIVIFQSGQKNTHGSRDKFDFNQLFVQI